MGFRKLNKFADRGKYAETKVQEHLEEWSGGRISREYQRLTDTKAAGRTIKAAAADFEFYSLNSTRGFFGLIEVKETEHAYRLSRSKVSQLPRLRKRSNCGGLCVVLVYHSTINRWRVVDAAYLASTGDKGSWNLSQEPDFETPGGALHHQYPEVFP